MALDSAQKRGSAMLVSLPFRPWLAVPDGTLASTDRLSLLRFAAAIAPSAVVVFTSAPAARTYTVPSEDRTYTVPFEDRTYTVPAEDRTYTVEAA